MPHKDQLVVPQGHCAPECKAPGMVAGEAKMCPLNVIRDGVVPHPAMQFDKTLEMTQKSVASPLSALLQEAEDLGVVTPIRLTKTGAA